MPGETEIQIPDDFDTTSALADISSELFGQGDEGEGGEVSLEGGKEKAPTGTPAVVEPDPSLQAPENTEAVRATGAPTTWTKAALEKWATIDPTVQAEILKREEDMFRGLEQYKGKAELGQKYDTVVEPFRAVLQAENIDPVQLFQSFASNHYLLSRGSPEQKVNLAAALVTGYGIDLGALIDKIGNAPITRVDPALKALQDEIAELKGYRATEQNQRQAATQEQVLAEVNAFAADPAHPYFNELTDDIMQFLKAGEPLATAYEKAVYSNPITRQKEIDRLTAEKVASSGAGQQARVDKTARLTAADVSTSPRSRNGTVPTGSMDDTLSEVAAAIASRG